MQSWLVPAKGRQPHHTVATDEVVGLALKSSIADGWVEGYHLPVVAHLPIAWVERRDDFAPAAAAAAMNGRGERHRDVQDPICEMLRSGVDELVAD